MIVHVQHISRYEFFPYTYIYIYSFFKFQNETRWFFFNFLKQEIALFISSANKYEFPLYPLSFASDLILWLEKSDMGTLWVKHCIFFRQKRHTERMKSSPNKCFFPKSGGFFYLFFYEILTYILIECNHI